MRNSRVAVGWTAFIAGLLLVSCGDDDASGPVLNYPERIDSLEVVAEYTDSLILSWRAPGLVNAPTIPAKRYDLRYATFAINDSNWANAIEAMSEPEPGTPGTVEVMGIGALAPGTTYFIAIKAASEDNQFSALSNIAAGITVEVPRIIYVSSGGNDNWPGSADSAKATIRAGIAAALAIGRGDVLVAKGAYDENVAMADGISVRGGYDDQADWSRDIEGNVTTIRGVRRLPGIPLLATGIQRETWLEGLTIEGLDHYSPYGLYIFESPGLVVSECLVQGPDGSDGANGATGFRGTEGEGALGGDGGQGATGRPFVCIDSTIIGTYHHSSGDSGNGCYGAGGGAGGRLGLCSGRLPEDGGTGGTGHRGMDGELGYMYWCSSDVLGIWFARGGEGLLGHSGGCGGGGGGGGGDNSCSNLFGFHDGGDGGKGGRGGGGGGGGFGGKPGQSSIGVICIKSLCTIKNTHIVGGIGGNGGNGGPGGAGGSGTDGAAGEATPCGSGGHGGRGGPGGPAGYGGGGAGGSSWCLFILGATPQLVGNTYERGLAGAGGDAPHPGAPGRSGEVFDEYGGILPPVYQCKY